MGLRIPNDINTGRKRHSLIDNNDNNVIISKNDDFPSTGGRGK